MKKMAINFTNLKEGSRIYFKKGMADQALAQAIDENRTRLV
jgi:hypothetical protein